MCFLYTNTRKKQAAFAFFREIKVVDEMNLGRDVGKFTLWREEGRCLVSRGA
jgi:hypothetical protein